MRYRLMASFQGAPYQAGIGPSDEEVTLFAACPPPEELGFRSSSGHWRKRVSVEEIDALWESRPIGRYHGEPCMVLDDLGDRTHIAYLGRDLYMARRLGFWEVDRGVFEVVVPRQDITDLREERGEYELAVLDPAGGTLPRSWDGGHRETWASNPRDYGSAPDTGPLRSPVAGPPRGLVDTGPSWATDTRGPEGPGGWDDGEWDMDMRVDQAQDPRDTGTWAAVRDLDPRDAPESGDPLPRGRGGWRARDTGGWEAPDTGAWDAREVAERAAREAADRRAGPAPRSAGGWSAREIADAAAREAAAGAREAATAGQQEADRWDPQDTVTWSPVNPGEWDSPSATRWSSRSVSPAHARPPAEPDTRAVAEWGPNEVMRPWEPATTESAYRQPSLAREAAAVAGADGTAVGRHVSRRSSRKMRVTAQTVFSQLMELASIPQSAYAVDAEVDGAMCLIRARGGYEVFSSNDRTRHEVRFFEDEEAAYFYLFGILAAEAVRSGHLGPQTAPPGHRSASAEPGYPSGLR